MDFLKFNIRIYVGKLFKLKAHKTTVRTEIVAGGIITFLTMSYILIVNPNILSASGMDKAALFTATALASVLGTMFMAFILICRWHRHPVWGGLTLSSPFQ